MHTAERRSLISRCPPRAAVLLDEGMKHFSLKESQCDKNEKLPKNPDSREELLRWRDWRSDWCRGKLVSVAEEPSALGMSIVA